jgi:hypothetical protein
MLFRPLPLFSPSPSSEGATGRSLAGVGGGDPSPIARQILVRADAATLGHCEARGRVAQPRLTVVMREEPGGVVGAVAVVRGRPG